MLIDGWGVETVVGILPSDESLVRVRHAMESTGRDERHLVTGNGGTVRVVYWKDDESSLLSSEVSFCRSCRSKRVGVGGHERTETGSERTQGGKGILTLKEEVGSSLLRWTNSGVGRVKDSVDV